MPESPVNCGSKPVGDDPAPLTEPNERLQRLAGTKRLVFFAGLPATGKSRFLQQFAHLAHAAGRPVHRLQWDVARLVFEACPAARRYPMLAGVTHPMIRKAAGAWARDAVVRWEQRLPGATPLLVGEAPLVGHRFIELARREDDGVEALLAAATCCFVIPVPSVEVRRFIEAERERRADRPVHAREREDALPHVLRSLWEELARAARLLGFDVRRGEGGAVPYDPALYERVYRHVLRHRRVQTIPVDTLLPAIGASVHAFGFPAQEVVPTPEEARHFIHAAERRYPDSHKLHEEMHRWYVV